MKRLIFCIPLLAGLIPLVRAAQQGTKAADAVAPKTNFVRDDDGGFTEIVPVDPASQVPRAVGAMPIMNSVQQVSIFLGVAWADREVRPRQNRLNDMDVTGGHPVLAEFHNRSVEVVPAAARVEDFSDLSKKLVNDLTIQLKLVEMLETHAMPAPAASTIYMVFLAPGIKSTLGTSKAGVSYSAYHNLLHVAAGEIRYVVVPYHEDADRHYAAASQAFANTAFNPTGGPN
jgi:hypothetical protein